MRVSRPSEGDGRLRSPHTALVLPLRPRPERAGARRGASCGALIAPQRGTRKH